VTSSWTKDIGLGHFVRFYDNSDQLKWKYQNFYIGSTIKWEDPDGDDQDHIFAPFGFSGLSTSREGGLEPAALVFPNNQLAREQLGEALRGGPLPDAEGDDIANGVVALPYVAEVDVCRIDPDYAPNSDGSIDSEAITRMVTYTGQCTGGGWNDTSLQMQLSSVLDAATADVPTRTLQQRLVGNLPFSSSVRLR